MLMGVSSSSALLGQDDRDLQATELIACLHRPGNSLDILPWHIVLQLVLSPIFTSRCCGKLLLPAGHPQGRE